VTDDDDDDDQEVCLSQADAECVRVCSSHRERELLAGRCLHNGSSASFSFVRLALAFFTPNGANPINQRMYVLHLASPLPCHNVVERTKIVDMMKSLAKRWRLRGGWFCRENLAAADVVNACCLQAWEPSGGSQWCCGPRRRCRQSITFRQITVQKDRAELFTTLTTAAVAASKLSLSHSTVVHLLSN